MVVQNRFEVTLYNPKTGGKHKEFYKDGNVYVEAYKEGQYFIEVKMANQAGCHGRAKRDKAMASFTVDKTPLGYGQPLFLHGTAERAGILTKEGVRAFEFVPPTLNVDADKTGPNPMAPLYGEVVVSFHETWQTTYMAPVVSPSSFGSSAGSTNSSAFSAKATMKVDIPAELEKAKVLRSTAGTAMIPEYMPAEEAPSPAAVSPLCGKKSKPSFRLKSEYEWGPLITTIRLRYCSPVGLIVAGVMPKPRPDWTIQDAVPARAPAATPPSFDHSKVVSQKINYQDDNGMAHEAMQYDLTGLSDDDDDDDKDGTK